MAPSQQPLQPNPNTLQTDSSSIFMYSSLFSPRAAGSQPSAISQHESKRVDSIYKNIMQSEI